MLIDELKNLRERAVQQFCDVMEFKAFTELAYQFSSEYTKNLPQNNSVAIGYSLFAHSIGLNDKTVQINDLPKQFALAHSEYLLPLMHQQQVAIFEHLFFDVLRVLLIDQPLHLPSRRQIEYSVITTAQTKEEIILVLIERELSELKYKSVSEWFDYLENLVADCTVTQDDRGGIAEAKATRDLFVHNAGVVNDMYIRKAGNYTRFKVGEVASVAGHYTRDSWQLLTRVILLVLSSRSK